VAIQRSFLVDKEKIAGFTFSHDGIGRRRNMMQLSSCGQAGVAGRVEQCLSSLNKRGRHA
jgi:hypothetical protein